ncbi:MAG: TlyA family RNA methyltransferase, partial [Candidatus Aureabacteria bacterium]|nr:TlyA family RNA methyltransferase [Candidatus Auribacterota bacterium]
PGKLINIDSPLVVKEGLKYVGRGGFKLECAIDTFKIDVKDKVCIDIGSSTGGFTDCLLKKGAKKVFAVDVGYGQIDYSLRKDKRVVLLEKTNARYLRKDRIGEKVDLVTIDVSFISLDKILPVSYSLLERGGECIALIKPQFEAGRKDVEKGGVVRNESIRLKVVSGIKDFCVATGYSVVGCVESPLKGPAGNVEYLIYAEKKNEGQEGGYFPEPPEKRVS